LKHSKFIYIIFFVVFSFVGNAQEYELRFYLGQNYYQGDLAPQTSIYSLSQGRLAWSMMVGKELNDVFDLNLKFMLGQIGGADMNSKDASRRQRNLSFDSPIYEFGINTEINLNYFLKGLNKYGINLYYTTGVNIFRFAPKAIKRNQFGKLEIIDLQPLGTEGQGLPGYDDYYKLTQINIPFGMGLKFHLFDNVEMGIEAVPRLTFTDHLDDVSGNYVATQTFLDANRPITAMLANRSSEVGASIDDSLGSQRGNSENNDWFLFLGVYLSYNIGDTYTPIKFTSNTPDPLIETGGTQN